MDVEQSRIGSVLFRATATHFDIATGLWTLWHPNLTGVLQEDLAAGELYARELVEVMRVLRMPNLIYQAMLDRCKIGTRDVVMPKPQTDWFFCGFCCMIGEIIISGGAGWWLVAMRQVTVETAVLARYAPRHGKAIVLS